MPSMRFYPSEGAGTGGEGNMKHPGDDFPVMEVNMRYFPGNSVRFDYDEKTDIATFGLKDGGDWLFKLKNFKKATDEKKAEYPGLCHECGEKPEGKFYTTSGKGNVYCFDCAHMFEDKTKPYSEWPSTKRRKENL